MKDRKTVFIYIFVIFSLLGIIKINEMVETIREVNYKNKNINDYVIKLKECFDLENKNKRRIHESLNLIEYCVKKYGMD